MPYPVMHQHKVPYPVMHHEHLVPVPGKHHESHVPEVHKKVHFVEKITEIDRDGKHEVIEETRIDMEADDYIQQKHKNFDKYKRGSSKVY